MRAINVRFLTILVVCGVVLAVGVYFLHDFQVRRQAKAELQAAQDAKEAGPERYEDAFRFYSRYLRINPKDTDAREELGLLCIAPEVGQYEDGCVLLEEVVRQDSGRSKARRELVKLYMRRGISHLRQAEEHLKVLLKESPDDAELLVWRGQCHRGRDQVAEAEECFKSAIDKAPKSLDAYLAMASLLGSQPDREKEAEGWIDKMVENNPTSADAYSRRGRYRSNNQRLDEAEKDAQESLKLDPDNEQALSLAARCAVARNDCDAARKYAARLLETYPRNVESYHALSVVENLESHPEKALEWLDKGITATRYPYLLWEKGMLLVSLKRTDEAEKTLEKLEQYTHFNSDLRGHLEAMISYLRGDWAKAVEKFEEVRPGLSQLPGRKGLVDTGHLAAIECYRRLGRTELAKQARKKAEETGAASAPRNPMVAIVGLIADGKIDQAIAVCRAVLASEDPPPATNLLLAQALMTKNLRIKDPASRQWAEVEAAFSEAAKAMPDSLEVILGQSSLLVAQGRRDEVPKHLRSAIGTQQKRRARWSALINSIEQESDTARAAALLDASLVGWAKDNAGITRAKELLEAGDREQALKTLAARRDFETNAWKAWEMLYQLAAQDKEWDQASALLDEAQQDCGDTVSLRLARAALALAKDRKSASETIKRLRGNTDKFSQQQRISLWHKLAQATIVAADLPLALDLQRQAAAADSTDLEQQEQWFVVAARADDDEAMQQALNEIARIDLKGPSWHYHSALRLCKKAEEKGKTKGESEILWREALDHVSRARTARPQWAILPRLAGLIHERLGEEKDAIANLQEAINLGDRDLGGINTLAELLRKAGRMQEWRQVLKLVEGGKTVLSPSALANRAEDSLRTGDYDSAEADYGLAVERLRQLIAKSEDFRQHREFARYLLQYGKLALRRKDKTEADARMREAETALRRAAKLEPNDPLSWALLIEAARLREADSSSINAILDEIRKTVSPEKKALILGQSYAQLQRIAEAEQQYLAALAQSKNDPVIVRNVAQFYLLNKNPKMKEKADPLLRMIIASDDPAHKNHVAWARFELALLLARSGSYEDLKSALELLDKNLALHPDSEDELRLKAQLLVRVAGRKERQEALDIFTHLAERPNAEPEDCFNLARLLEADNRWSDASEQLRRVLGAPRVPTNWMVFIIGAKTRHQELLDAQADYDRLEKQIGSDHRVAVALRANLMAARGRHAEAIRTLNAFIEKPSTDTPNRTDRMQIVAEQLESIAANISDPNRKEAAAPYLTEVEKHLRTLAAIDPNQEMRLVAFLGRSHRLEEALQLIEKAWEKGKPLAVAGNVAALLLQDDPSEEQIQRMETILQDAIQRHGEDVHLLLAMAQLRAVQRRYDDAEDYYRRVIEKDPKNGLAMNNLAVFLALRQTKLDEALDFINQAIRIRGPQDHLLDSRASVYIARGQWKEAIADMDVAIQSSSTGIRHFHRAQALFGDGQKSEAAAELSKAESLGLTAEKLQPLERPAYRELKKQLQE
ncbi:MAG: tetratricopeptide repeat protein [Pirellulales bacterium]|nr:tetratricopeptide repeat protein [Pirellulales bacterium]